MIQQADKSIIDGLVLRHFAGESDFARMASILTASEQADHMDRHVTAQDLANAFQGLSNCDPYQDVVIAEVNGETVGYSRGWWQDDSAGRIYTHNGFVSPGWRRKGIGAAMLGWMETRLGNLAASHPPGPGKFFQANVTQFQAGKASLLERSGYQPVRCFYEMVRPTLEDIPAYPLPVGVELRPASPDHYRAIWDLADETAQDEWGYKKLTDEDFEEWQSSPEFQPSLWQVAWDISSGLPVGQVLGYINHAENKQFDRRRGYTEGIGVTHSWRRRGLARALICHSLLAQKAAGMSESALVADTDSQSNVTRLYESCGFRVVKKDTLYRKPIG